MGSMPCIQYQRSVKTNVTYFNYMYLTTKVNKITKKMWKSQRFNYKEKIIVVISDLKLGVYHENEKKKKTNKDLYGYSKKKLILHSNLPQAKKGFILHYFTYHSAMASNN